MTTFESGELIAWRLFYSEYSLELNVDSRFFLALSDGAAGIGLGRINPAASHPPRVIGFVDCQVLTSHGMPAYYQRDA
jgi:hypothetical protein